jgi:hypothetical protein
MKRRDNYVERDLERLSKLSTKTKRRGTKVTSYWWIVYWWFYTTDNHIQGNREKGLTSSFSLERR